MNQGTLQSLLVEDADKKRLEELRAFVIYHNHRYHTLDAPEITDDEYNAAFQELLRLEERHPEWRSPDSPTNRIGGQVLSSLETKAHTRRMYSLDNVFDAEEWQGFLKRLDNAQEGLEHAFWCDPKMDGLALELVYENGRFVEALTRGDGEVGELVTEAMQTVRNLPKVLHGDAPERLEVRGEVIFRRRDFALLIVFQPEIRRFLQMIGCQSAQCCGRLHTPAGYLGYRVPSVAVFGVWVWGCPVRWGAAVEYV